ncbi:Calcitonin-like Diuretic Hormone Receptor-RA [Frankliniella occidentalis]|nr:Calcitonin-like Diuretic Hormone Receptor-RA [Frankliniella occidentalis]
MSLVKPEWKSTVIEYQRECLNMMNQTRVGQTEDADMCPSVWDGWMCWPDTLAGTSAYQPCPKFVFGFDPLLSAHKDCLENGSWFRHPETGQMWSNYTTCIDYSDYQFKTLVIKINETGYLISLVALLLSLGILSYFKSLRCTRIWLHMNLFASFAVNSALWLMFFTIIIPDVDLMQNNLMWCQVAHVVTQYFLLTNYCWMLCEGLYLHTVLVNAFGAEERLVKWLYMLGWGMPLPIIVLYALLRGMDVQATQRCWMEETPYNMVMTVPVCVFMVTNFFFLTNIVRVLWGKLRAGPQVGSHAERPSRTLLQATRATLLLVPLLGLQYLVIPFRPDEKGSDLERLYEIISAIFASFQGLAVALLFCFCNGEVLAQMRRRMDFAFHRRRANSYTATTVSVRRLSSSARRLARKQGKSECDVESRQCESITIPAVV